MFKEAPVFRPTMEEFRDFNKFIQSVWDKAVPYGIMKIIPPAEWRTNQERENSYRAALETTIPEPVRQVLKGSRGKFQQVIIEEPPMLGRQFEACARQVEIEENLGNLMDSRIILWYLYISSLAYYS